MQLSNSHRRATGGVIDAAVRSANRIATLHGTLNSGVLGVASINADSPTASRHCNALVVIRDLQLARRSTFCCAIGHCGLLSFSFARLVSDGFDNAFWYIRRYRSPSAFPLLRRWLWCLLLPIARNRRANNGSRSAVVVVDGARWAKPTLGVRGAGTQQPQTQHQQPAQEMC